MTETLSMSAYDVPVDFDAVERNLQRENFSFGVFRDPPGQEWNNFVHRTDEYVLIAEGKLAMRVGDEKLVAEPGDLVRIPRGAYHSLKTVSAEGSVWLYGYGYWGKKNE